MSSQMCPPRGTTLSRHSPLQANKINGLPHASPLEVLKMGQTASKIAPRLEWAPRAGQRSGRCFDRGPGVAVLELLRAEIAQGGMETTSVVDLVDDPWKVLGDVGEGFVGHRIDRLDLESLHEAFGLGVVVGIASAPHRTDKTAAKQGFPIGLSGVLANRDPSGGHSREEACGARSRR